MKTCTPFSTISYNTNVFLVRELDNLINEGKIEFYSFINHIPEEDETKAHKHLYIIPCGLVDTVLIQNKLRELDLSDVTKPPLGVIRFVHSKFADWYLYAIHDIDYLASKCEERKYHYLDKEFYVSDKDYFNELIHMNDFSKYKAFAKFRESVASGVTFAELFKNGFIPVQQIYQYKMAYYLLKGKQQPSDERTERAGRAGHEETSNKRVEFVDVDTGEII